MTQTYDGSGALLFQEGLVRTDLYCHGCSKNFIAEIDYSIDGNHTAICPHCSHEHMRTIKAGVVTEERWGSSNEGLPTIKAKRIWKHDVLVMRTSSASQFIRDKWLERLE